MANLNNISKHLLADLVKIQAIKVLYQHSEGMTGRALGSVVGTSPFKINKVLQNLVEQGIVTETVVGRAHLYRLNRDHIFITSIINKLIELEKNILLNLGQTIMPHLDPKPLSIILYGSVARGDEKPNSDLDLLFVYDNHAKSGKISNNAYIMELISRQYGNPVSIIRIRISDFQHPEPDHKAFVKNIIKEGKNIAGLSVTELLNYNG